METVVENKKSVKSVKDSNHVRINWVELGLNLSTTMVQAFVVGIATAAGGYAFNRATRTEESIGKDNLVQFAAKKTSNS